MSRHMTNAWDDLSTGEQEELQREHEMRWNEALAILEQRRVAYNCTDETKRSYMKKSKPIFAFGVSQYGMDQLCAPSARLEKLPDEYSFRNKENGVLPKADTISMYRTAFQCLLAHLMPGDCPVGFTLNSAKALQAFSSGKVPSILKIKRQEQLPRKSGKRSDLLKLMRRHPDWYSQILTYILTSERERWKVPAILLACTGARPAELSLGIQLIAGVDIKGHALLRITIQGAKQRFDRDGQRISGLPERTLTFDPNADQFLRFLFDRTRAVGGAMIVFAPIKTNGEFVQLGTNAISHMLRRVGVKVLGEDGKLVSAYIFRHYMASRLKSSGLDEELIGAALGQISIHSQKHYSIARSNGYFGLLHVGYEVHAQRSPTFPMHVPS
ncbi:MAG: site-specific integrase [Desulfovibrionaceae bacterium]